MHTKPHSINRIALAAVIALSGFSSANAAAYMTWGGDYVSSSQLLQGDNPLNRSGSDQYGDPHTGITSLVGEVAAGREFSDSTALSPTSGYSGPVFYGGGSVMQTGGTNIGFNEFMVSQGGSDAIQINVKYDNTNPPDEHFFTYFKQAQFDVDYNSGTYGLSPNTVFNLSTGQVSEGGSADIETHWVVKDGTSFYVSQNTVLLAQNATFSTPLSSITGWALWNLGSSLASLDLDEPGVLGSYGAHTFTDVQGLGFYIEHENATYDVHAEITSFVVSVPEPSRALLLLGGLFPIVLRRRR